jgi:hypothetical protein
MSLSVKLSNAIEQVIEAFISRVAQEHDVSEDQLRALWSGNASTPKRAKAKSSNPLTDIDTEDVSPERLMSCTVSELKALCRARGLVLKGKKADLISRLSGVAVDNLPAKKAAKKSKKKSQSATASSKVIKALTKKVPEIAIRRNDHNNLEHPETGLVFNKVSQKVFGKQNDDGTVDDLTDADIELCKKFKFKFDIPENLDSKTDLTNVEVEELEVEDSDESDEESEIEDEESDIDIVLGDDDDDEEEDSDEFEYEEVTDDDE